MAKRTPVDFDLMPIPEPEPAPPGPLVDPAARHRAAVEAAKGGSTATAVLDELPPPSGGDVQRVQHVPKLIPPGKIAGIAIQAIPYLLDGLEPGEMILVGAKYGEHLIKQKLIKQTWPDVYVATLHKSGVNVGGRTITRDRPELVSHELAMTAVMRADDAAKQCRWPISGVKIISEEQAIAWDPSQLPPDPRPAIDPEVSPDPRDRTPSVRFKALAKCLVGGTISCQEGEERDGGEYYAILGCFLSAGPDEHGRDRGLKQCKLIAPPSDRGKRWYGLIEKFDREKKGIWSPLNNGFPDYFTA